MSYIRALSNPESLYVVGVCDNRIEFYWTDEEGNQCDAFGPHDEFITLCDAYIDECGATEPISVGCFTLQEKKIDGHFKEVLNINGTDLVMWAVTWEHIVRHREWQRRRKLWYRIRSLFTGYQI